MFTLDRSGHIVKWISLGVYLIALLQFQFKEFDFHPAYNWELQFYVLISLSIVATLITFFFTSSFILLVTLVLRFMFLFLIGLSLGESLGIELLVMAGILLGTGIQVPFPLNAVFSGGFILLISLFQVPIYAMGVNLDSPDLYNVITFSGQLVFIGFLSCYLRHILMHFEKEKHNVYRLQRALTKLSDANIGFQQYAVDSGRKSREEERKRISREIHDTAGHIISNVLMMIKTSIVMAKGQNREEIEMLERAKRQAEEGMVEIRRSVHELYEQEETTERGLKAIAKMAKTFSQVTGIKVRLEYGNVPFHFSSKVDLFIYRMVQEGLLNAFKHGHATEVRIFFWQNNGEVQVSVVDNGSGSGKINKGIGIKGMEDRIFKLDGSLKARSIEEGFELVARIPIQGRDE